MSISEHISDRVRIGELFPLMPPRKGQRRWMFLSKDLHDALANPPAGEEDRHDELRADLVSFLIQRYITPEFLKLLQPKSKGVWEIRSRRVEPQIRVFGHFAKKDVFIALAYKYRDDLGDISNPSWIYEIRSVEDKWKELFFGQYHPKKTSDRHELYSGAIDDKHITD